MIFYLKCSECGLEFQESCVQESHDVPCYLFEGSRKLQKQQADKFKRRHLCIKCHQEFEEDLRHQLKIFAENFAEKYFEKEGENDTNTA